MRVIRTGVTRTVILLGPWAIKIPSFRGAMTTGLRARIESFCLGIVANNSEYLWKDHEPWAGKIAPCRWSLLGFIQVYPRCEPAPGDAELFRLDPCPGDIKPDNYGYLNGRLVRVDYEM